MFKFLKKPKVIKFLTMMLVVVFCINLTGCNEMEENGYNGVETNRVVKVGTGANTVGYTVYAESTFDPMTKELFIGYLLSGREFSLVVVPGDKNGSDYSFNMENYLYVAAQNGVYKYEDSSTRFADPERKLLLYYVTDEELKDWFNEFSSSDNFFNSVNKFMETEMDLEDYNRYTCKKLVNMGGGLSANDFCDYILKNKDLKRSDGTIKEYALFNNSLTGGMILLFGYSSIEGYLTYSDIADYSGSAIANYLDGCSSNNSCFSTSSISSFNIDYILGINAYRGNGVPDVVAEIKSDPDYSYVQGGRTYTGADVINSYANGGLTGEDRETFIQKVAQSYTRYVLSKTKPEEKLATTYTLIGSALLSDTGASSISTLRSNLTSKSELTESEQAQLELVNMLYDFKNAAHKDAFAMKFSYALFTRYTSVKNYPDSDNLLTGQKVTSITDKNLEETKQLIKGKPGESYVLLVTSDGFVLDRGTEEDQMINGSMEMLGMGTILAEMVRMDACPNATAAKATFDLLSDMKIALGIASLRYAFSPNLFNTIGLITASVVAETTAQSLGTSVGVSFWSVALKLIPGVGQIISIIDGISLLIEGIKDKARLKGMGASETNYCGTYTATIASLLESLELTIPIYKFNIGAETDQSYNENLSIKYCDEDGTNCGDPIPMYYYADVETVKELDLEGSPTLMYFEDGTLVDYIFGASTPSFVVEVLRLWGLLAMREIVYKSQIDWEQNMVSISHTSNLNARTFTIKEMKYCYNMTYGQSLYGQSIDCILSNISTVTKDVSYNNSGKIVNYWTGSLLDIASLNLSDVTTASNYAQELYNSTEYKFNQYIDYNNITIVDSEEISVNIKDGLENVSNKIFEILNPDSTVSDTITQITKINGSDGKYYIAHGTDVNTIYYSSKDLIASTEPYVLLKIATYNNDVDIEKFKVYTNEYEVRFEGTKIHFIGLNGVVTATYDYQSSYDEVKRCYLFKIDGKEYCGDSQTPSKIGLIDEESATASYYEVRDLLEYINNKLEFNNSSIELPFYFTASIKETTSAQAHSSTNKTCSGDKYLYKRHHNVLGIEWDTYECLTDDKVKSNDTALESQTFTYYTTSTLAGYITIQLGKGTTELVATARYLNENEE